MAGIPGWEPRRLEGALTRAEPLALRDFYRHFRPLLLHHARLLGIERSVRDETVMTFIGDILLELPKRSVFPENLSAYVLTAFRYRVGSLYRRHVLENAVGAESPEVQAGGEEIEAESCSAFSRRAAAGGEADDLETRPDTRQALNAFWRRVRARLSLEDRVLLGLLRNETTGREIADTLRIEPGTVRVRIHRLRIRVRTAASETLDELPVAESALMTAILRRSGLLHEDPPAATVPDSRRHPGKMRIETGATTSIEAHDDD